MTRAPSLALTLIAAPAFAAGPLPTSCDAAHVFKLDWDAQTPKNSNLGTGARAFLVTNGAGQSVTVTMSFAGNIANYINSGFGQTPNISVQNVGGVGATENTLFLATDFPAYESNIGTAANAAIVRFGFSTPVREVQFRIMDIDYAAAQFRDWVRVGATDFAGNYVPTLTTPYGRNNVSNPGLTTPGVAYVGPITAALGGVSTAIVNGDAMGNGISALTEDYGAMDAYVIQPATQVEVRYANGPAPTMTGTAGVQSISIHDISFCPMPVLTVTKGNTPFTDPVSLGVNPKLIPGGDVSYAITLTNNGGSTVDLTGLLADDVLPANVTFYNGNYDGSTVGPFQFTTVGGATIAGGAVAYSNTGAAPFAYTAGMGYDGNVRAVRLSGTGSIPPGGAMTVRFRTQIK